LGKAVTLLANSAKSPSRSPGGGQPAWSPGQLALVCVLQFAEGLSNRQTAVPTRTHPPRTPITPPAGLNLPHVHPTTMLHTNMIRKT
jgi:hypothetical protein